MRYMGVGRMGKWIKMSAVERDCSCVIFVYLSSHCCLIIHSKSLLWVS